jgi:hypothetical protein
MFHREKGCAFVLESAVSESERHGTGVMLE